MEELLLWRWSTAVQITSAVLIAVFFVVVGRSTGWRGVHWWVGAWASNALALCVTWGFWTWQPAGIAMQLLLMGYLASKTLFLLLLLLGVRAFKQPIGAPEPKLGPLLLPVAVFALVGGLLMQSIDVIGLVQASSIALLLGAAAFLCWRAPGRGLGWLGVGCLIRALLAAIEVVAYAWHRAPGAGGLPDFVGVFLASHSSFDTGAEWVIALGCVLALTHRTHAELVQSHAELHAAHDELKRVAERDPLTGLYNRRMLSELLERKVAHGAQLLFFDLDDFKRINDEDGHGVGDACLRRFAGALEEQFDTADAVVRFAGDEFLVIVPAQPRDAVDARIQTLRQQLRADTPGARPLRFSAGVAMLAPGADPQQALREADMAMYRDKALQRA